MTQHPTHPDTPSAPPPTERLSDERIRELRAAYAHDTEPCGVSCSDCAVLASVDEVQASRVPCVSSWGHCAKCKGYTP